MITDHKPLVATFKKDVASLSHRLQRILVQIVQYNIRIQDKPGPQLYITDWPSRPSHKTNREKEIQGIYISFNTTESCTDIQDCMTVEEIRKATMEDEHLSTLTEPELHDWPSMKAEVQRELQPY